MAGEIRADYDQLTTVAARFSNNGRAVQDMLKNVTSHAEVLEGGSWIGRGVEAFAAEMNDEVIPAVRRLIEAMEEANRATNQISRTVRQAEEEAAAPFRA
ncbi:MAG: WXG100 family type VII secretion target [Caldilineaceae bacterium]|nr:WXG100 family type VII secretion target [Caldilineaceae bacterium]MCB9137919.1 WXG100 family type VII secretion target [Caldilineaceae bacterium]